MRVLFPARPVSAFLPALLALGACSALSGASAHSAAGATQTAPAASPARPSSTGASAAATAANTVSSTDRGVSLVRVALPPSRAGSGRVVPYTFEMEKGLKLDRTAVATRVAQILEAQRGWQAKDHVNFVPVPLGSTRRPAIRVTMVSPTNTDRLCAPLRTQGRVSCWNGSRAVLNSSRWTGGAATYGKDLTHYRIYLVNHEVGHGLGHHHQHCPRKGAPAPVMVQQTKTLEGCRANPYP